MRKLQLPNRQIETQYIKFAGGLDLATPVLSLRAGNALDAMNYEPGLLGGYRRIDGFERVDGRPAPSAATYTYLEGVFGAMPAVGSTLAGQTSGATGVVVRVDAARAAISVTKVTGVFVSAEVVKVGATVIGTLNTAPAVRGYRTAKEDAITLAAAADVYRADIAAVPGQGPVRGAWMYQGVLYAWRDAVGGASCAMFKSTAAGWVAIALGWEVRFTNANINVVDGVVLTQGAVNGQVKRVVLETGTLQSAVNTGRLILSTLVGGNFSAAAATTNGGGTLTIAAVQTAITLLPGGRYECINTNFAGSTATQRMYGVDGVNRAFEFDGTALVPIRTGMAVDAPKFILEHKKKLFLAFKGSVQYSGDGLPYQYTLLVGANELGMGEDITGMAVQTGDTLAIFTRNSSHQLNGVTNISFSLLPISKEVGAIPYTVQVVGKTYALDDRGIIVTDRVQAYGNFSQATISAEVQPIIEALRAKVAGSVVYRSRSQMRVYGTDGSGIIMAFDKDGGLIGTTQLQYQVNPVCFASTEDAAGKDVVFFGGDNGMVYQADKGSSFDGAAIEAYLRMPFNNISSPRVNKGFKLAIMEMSAASYAAIRFQPEFSYGDPNVGTHRLQTGEVVGGGGYWDVSLWDNFFYDAALVSQPRFKIDGSGLNMALLFYSSSNYDLGHVLQGMLIHFFKKRLKR
jgi:hypothetical protein